MNRRPRSIGLMGCGTVADYGHIPAIQRTDGLSLHAVYDPSADALERMQETYGIPEAFTDAGMFFDSGIEAVTIASPVPCHKENVLDAAGCGLPILCEKPLAMDRSEAAEMIVATDAAGVSLYTAFCYRFSPCALKIQELLASKAIGDVRSLRLIYNWHCHGKFVTDASGNPTIQARREGQMLEGGPLLSCGTHQIDLAMFWLDSDVIRFDGHGAWVDEYEAPDHVWLHMDHANGAHTMVEMSYSYHQTSKNPAFEFVYELIGTDGVIRYDREASSFRMDNASGTTDFEYCPEKSFEGMYAERVHALDSGRSDLLASADDGMRVVDIARKTIDAAIENRRTSRMRSDPPEADG